MIRFQNIENWNGIWEFHYEERVLSDVEILAAKMENPLFGTFACFGTSQRAESQS